MVVGVGKEEKPCMLYRWGLGILSRKITILLQQIYCTEKKNSHVKKSLCCILSENCPMKCSGVI